MFYMLAYFTGPLQFTNGREIKDNYSHLHVDIPHVSCSSPMMERERERRSLLPMLTYFKCPPKFTNGGETETLCSVCWHIFQVPCGSPAVDRTEIILCGWLGSKHKLTNSPTMERQRYNVPYADMLQRSPAVKCCICWHSPHVSNAGETDNHSVAYFDIFHVCPVTVLYMLTCSIVPWSSPVACIYLSIYLSIWTTFHSMLTHSTRLPAGH